MELVYTQIFEHDERSQATLKMLSIVLPIEKNHACLI